jgi:isoquinoline 1-oxidoreductase alpha subunit
MLNLTINDQVITTDLSPDTPLLWLLRDELQLTATKFGCGQGQCGACTVHLNGQALRSCVLPIGTIGEAQVTTMENETSTEMQALQAVWAEQNIPQCGYCQVGQLMSASALLKFNNQPSNQDIELAMSGNICRCGTYQRIKQGLIDVAERLATEVK